MNEWGLIEECKFAKVVELPGHLEKGILIAGNVITVKGPMELQPYLVEAIVTALRGPKLYPIESESE